MTDVPDEVLAAWTWPGPVRLTPLHDGLINPTWRVDAPAGPVAALQELNTRVFRPTVHEDIAAVTAHLAAKGLTTPRLVPTRADHLWHTDPSGRVWRVLSWVGSRTVHLATPALARSAGILVGRFHAAVADLQRPFVHVRPGTHDTDRHAAVLRETLDAHPGHRLQRPIAALADELLAAWAALRSELPELPRRVVHGDLKISNVRFDGDEALALIDLDTLARGTLGAELGDALRSWCGVAGEDTTEAVFDLDVFEAAIAGWAVVGGATTSEAEWTAIVPSVARIATELAMRFAADALEESYFGWDAAGFPAAGEHNLARALGQAALARAVLGSRAEAEARLARARSA